MNIEDLEYALAAAEINEAIIDKKINELEEQRLQKFALKGQEKQKNPKTKEQIDLEEEREKYVLEKSKINDLLNIYNSLKNKINDKNTKINLYSRYSLENFINLKKEKEDRLNEVKKKIDELEKARIPSLKLKDAKTKIKDKTEEQLSLEKELSSHEIDIKKLNEIEEYTNTTQEKLKSIKDISDMDMIVYATKYQNIISDALNANLPYTIIINLMRDGLSSEFTQNGEKLTEKSKEELREKIRINRENIKKRKDLDNARLKQLKEELGEVEENTPENNSYEEPTEQEEKSYELSVIKNSDNQPIFKDENRIDKDHSWMDAQNANNLGYSRKENLEKEKLEEEKNREMLMNMPLDELKKGIEKLEKTKRKLDDKIIDIDLNASWEGTPEAMEKYVKVSRKLKLCEEILSKRAEEEIEIIDENMDEINNSALSSIPLTTGTSGNVWVPGSTAEEITNKEKKNSSDKDASKTLDDELIDIKDILNNDNSYKLDKFESFKKSKEKFSLSSVFDKVKEKIKKSRPLTNEEMNYAKGGKTL